MSSVCEVNESNISTAVSACNAPLGTPPGSVVSMVGGTAGQAALSSEVKLAALSGEGCSGDVGESDDVRFVYGCWLGVGERRSCEGCIRVTGSYSGV